MKNTSNNERQIEIQRGRFTPENIPLGSPSFPYSTHTYVMELREQNRTLTNEKKYN